jgi:hypothetical protein
LAVVGFVACAAMCMFGMALAAKAVSLVRRSPRNEAR